MKIKWTPHPKQIQALQSLCFETLFGGARGGGKTDCGMAWLLYDFENPKLRQLVIRRNYDDLKDWIDRARSFYADTGAEFTMSTREIVFPSGSKIILGHLKDDAAYTKYQGHEYQRILVEELTHIPSEELYMKLIASCRSTVKGLQPRVFATTNPGEIGHAWTKKRFVTITEPGKVYTDPVSGRTRLFIQSKVEDNPSLMNADPEYVHFLDSLPDGLREQWRLGSWDDVEIKGAYYVKQINQAQNEGRICRIPYEVSIPTDFYWDIGIDDETAIWAVQKWGKEIRFLECWTNSGVSLVENLKMLVLSKYGENIGTMYFPHDIRVRELTTGRTRLETIEKYALEYNFKVEVCSALNPEERVNAARVLFGQYWFDSERCEQGLGALRFYHKEYDEKTLTFRNQPKHDWSSHYADAFSIVALMHQDLVKKTEPKHRFSSLGIPTQEEESDIVNPFGIY